MKGWVRALVAVVAIASASCTSTSPAEVEDRSGDFTSEVWLSGLDVPVSLVFMPSGDALVIEKGGWGEVGQGKVKVVSADGSSVSVALTLPVCSIGERGLIGLALDPRFAENGYVYLFYTDPSRGCAMGGERHSVQNRLSRFTMIGSVIDPASEVVLVDGLDAAQSGHNGGGMAFGPDGTLFVGVGNASEDGAPDTPSADASRREGKILRLAPDSADVVPDDNPFLDQAGADPLVWAIGLRNPFTIAVRPDDGALFIADVGSAGEAAVEELNIGVAGADFGWPDVEGDADNGTESPVWSYGHEDGCGTIILGDFLATDAMHEDAAGRVTVADFLCGRVWTLGFDGASLESIWLIAELDGPMSDVATGSDGLLYVTDVANGEIVVLSPAT